MVRLFSNVKTNFMKAVRKNYLGIDVSKLWFDVTLLLVINHVKQPMLTQRFDNTTACMKAFKAWLKSQAVSYDENTLLVIENTGVYHRLIWSFCSSNNLQLHIGNAAHIKWSLGITVARMM
jgi:transposase